MSVITEALYKGDTDGLCTQGLGVLAGLCDFEAVYSMDNEGITTCYSGPPRPYIMHLGVRGKLICSHRPLGMHSQMSHTWILHICGATFEYIYII